MAESKSAALPLGYAPNAASFKGCRPRRLDHNAPARGPQPGQAKKLRQADGVPVELSGGAGAPQPEAACRSLSEPPATNQNTAPDTIPVKKKTSAKRNSSGLALVALCV